PCGVELKEQRSLSAAVRAQPTVHASAARGCDRVLERLAVPGAPPLANGRHGLNPSRRRWLAAGAALAATAAFALVLIAWPALFGERLAEGEFMTLTDSPGATPAGVQLDLVFAATLSIEDRERLLDEIDAKVVSGPSAIGRYRVQIATLGPEKTLERLLADLNSDTRIRFAGRALSEEAP